MWGETPHTPHIFARPPALLAVPRCTVVPKDASPFWSEVFGERRYQKCVSLQTAGRDVVYLRRRYAVLGDNRQGTKEIWYGTAEL